MKTSIKTIIGLATLGAVTSFAPQVSAPMNSISTTQRQMFGGTGTGLPVEDDDEAIARDTKFANAMGMSLEEYQIGISARTKMEEDIKNIRATGGDAAKGVTVERDGNSPPNHLVITVTADEEALGKKELEKELVAALKTASEQSKKGREDAQKGMMQFIAEKMKTMG